MVEASHHDKAICKFAADGDFYILVMSSRGLSGVKKQILGSISEYVVQNAGIPVLITKVD